MHKNLREFMNLVKKAEDNESQNMRAQAREELEGSWGAKHLKAGR